MWRLWGNQCHQGERDEQICSAVLAPHFPRVSVVCVCVWIYQTALIQPCSCCQYFGRFLFFCLFVGSNREVIRSDAVNVVSGSCTRSERSGSFSSRLGRGKRGGDSTGKKQNHVLWPCARLSCSIVGWHSWPLLAFLHPSN